MEQDQNIATWKSLFSAPKGNQNVALLLIPPVLPGLVLVNNFLRPQNIFDLPNSYWLAGGLSVALLLVRELRLRRKQGNQKMPYPIQPSADFID